MSPIVITKTAITADDFYNNFCCRFFLKGGLYVIESSNYYFK